MFFHFWVQLKNKFLTFQLTGTISHSNLSPSFHYTATLWITVVLEVDLQLLLLRHLCERALQLWSLFHFSPQAWIVCVCSEVSHLLQPPGGAGLDTSATKQWKILRSRCFCYLVVSRYNLILHLKYIYPKIAVVIVLKYLEPSLMHAAEQKRRHYKYRCHISWWIILFTRVYMITK